MYLFKKTVLSSIQNDLSSKQHLLDCAQSSAVLTAPVRSIDTGEPAPMAARTISAFLNRRGHFISNLPVRAVRGLECKRRVGDLFSRTVDWVMQTQLRRQHSGHSTAYNPSPRNSPAAMAIPHRTEALRLRN